MGSKSQLNGICPCSFSWMLFYLRALPCKIAFLYFFRWFLAVNNLKVGGVIFICNIDVYSSGLDMGYIKLILAQNCCRGFVSVDVVNYHTSEFDRGD